MPELNLPISPVTPPGLKTLITFKTSAPGLINKIFPVEPRHHPPTPFVFGISTKSQVEQMEGFDKGQSGTSFSPWLMCQAMWMNDAGDFCIWARRNQNEETGDSARGEVAWCTKSRGGQRVIMMGH